MYSERFHRVLSFYEPGLAPVIDASGAFHITAAGKALYPDRYLQTWGFYEGRAAVQDCRGWFHILADGSSLSDTRFAWCGNFQEGRCAVRFSDGTYSHITFDGHLAYEHRHRYAGDFREATAVVRYADDGLCGHIDLSGQPAHLSRYLDLDVFHKGYARARDEWGWFHVRSDGTPAYERRFAAIEPFYNGQSLAESLRGHRLVISEDGETLVEIDRRRVCSTHRRLLLIGNIGAGKSTVGECLAAELGWPIVRIDDARRSCGEGSAVGEVAAWAYFLRLATMSANTIVEFSGSGPLAPLLAQNFNQTGDCVLALWLTASESICIERLAKRALDVPYPDFGVPITEVVSQLHDRLHRELGGNRSWSGFPLYHIDGEQAAEHVRDQALQAVRLWMAPTLRSS